MIPFCELCTVDISLVKTAPIANDQVGLLPVWSGPILRYPGYPGPEDLTILSGTESVVRKEKERCYCLW